MQLTLHATRAAALISGGMSVLIGALSIQLFAGAAVVAGSLVAAAALANGACAWWLLRATRSKKRYAAPADTHTEIWI